MDDASFTVIWSEEDGEFVGLCDAFRSLSHLAAASHAALAGIRALVAEAMAEG
ncbi:MAG: hypothetical protein K2X11_03710 [Acetobacteraceae bacterium]|nr:hypothetical protein [Acetobacteraceae bacterium]